MTNNHPAALWRKVRAAFEGTEPAIAEARDSNAIRVPALARRFNVHPNSIYLRSRNRWRRPKWYVLTGRTHQAGERYRAAQKLDADLLALLRRHARAGTPCPTNGDLAPTFGCSASFLAQSFARLKKTEAIAVERVANRRRIKVRGVAQPTGWTDLREVAGTSAPPTIKAAPAAVTATGRTGRCLALIRAAAEAGAPCPKSPDLADRLGAPDHMAVVDMIDRLVARGAFTVERRTRKVRRFVFPDGVATGWTDYQVSRLKAAIGAVSEKSARKGALSAMGRAGVTLRPPPVSDALERATLILRRDHGLVVFDRWVLTGDRREKGQSFSVDGRTVYPDQLIALAAEYQAKAGAAAR
jgi:hypothetical protein